jgi:hypothetical protein
VTGRAERKVGALEGVLGGGTRVGHSSKAVDG